MHVTNIVPVNRTEIAVSLQNCVRSQKIKQWNLHLMFWFQFSSS